MMFYLWPCLIKIISPQEPSKANNRRHTEPGFLDCPPTAERKKRKKKAGENRREDTKSHSQSVRMRPTSFTHSSKKPGWTQSPEEGRTFPVQFGYQQAAGHPRNKSKWEMQKRRSGPLAKTWESFSVGGPTSLDQPKPPAGDPGPTPL